MKNQQMVLDFQSKIKELELKYNTQIDSAKLKQEADLNKIIVANLSKNFGAAQKATQEFGQQVQELNAGNGSNETPIGS